MAEQSSTSVVRAAYEAFLRGDIDGALALMSDDIDWNSPAVEGMPFGGPRRGKNAVADFFTKLNESEEILAFEPREYITQGERVPSSAPTRLASAPPAASSAVPGFTCSPSAAAKSPISSSFTIRPPPSGPTRERPQPDGWRPAPGFCWLLLYTPRAPVSRDW